MLGRVISLLDFSCEQEHQYPGPFLFSPVLLQCGLIKDVEIRFNIDMGAKLAEQTVGFLEGIREIWQGQALCTPRWCSSFCVICY